nr:MULTISPECIES: hypothetical protein [Ralstonia]
MALQQVEVQRDHAGGVAQLIADHALFGRAIHLLDADFRAALGAGQGSSVNWGSDRRRTVRMRVVVPVIVSMAAAVGLAVRMLVIMVVVITVLVLVTVVMCMVVTVFMVVAMLVFMVSRLPGNGIIVAAATTAARRFRLGGVVVGQQGGGEIWFHASIQNPEEALGSSPHFKWGFCST